MAIPISVIMSRIILIRLAINAEQDVGSAIDVFHDAFQHAFGGALVQPHIMQGFEPIKVLVDALFNTPMRYVWILSRTLRCSRD